MEAYYTLASDFISDINNKTITDMSKYIDTVVIDKNTQNGLLNFFNEIDPEGGKFKDKTFTGFEFTKPAAGMIPEFITWCQLTQDSIVVTVRLTINTSTDKINAINVKEGIIKYQNE